MTRVTEEQVNDSIESVIDMKVGEKTTLVLLKLKNGFEVVGTSACVDPANYNHEVGVGFAKKRAMDKVWELEGYKLQSQ